MAFPKEFLDVLRDRVPLSDVISKKVALSKKGREYSGLCPFHNEKTGSFKVNEEKGFYHCFGCGAHGDIITFEMQANNLSFYEAVQKLADSAGLEMPNTTPEEKERAKKYASLQEISELACKFYEEQLQGRKGQDALNYLSKKRQLSDDIISNFRLGYAPQGDNLYKYLDNKKVAIEDMQSLGLVRVSEKDGRPYDYFRNRVMFPICDTRGRVIAFGGRVLDDSLPKYLNSPETTLFHKGRVLYGLAQARDEAFKQASIIATEGYMDVIALNGAGIQNAVAPLGTAITEDQIAMLWKISRTPHLCFDGDNAGRKAAIRAALRALPILQAGKSLQFVVMPDGKDPDDLLKEGGAEAFNKVLNKAFSLSDMIWHSLIDGKTIKTPEQKAGLEKDINDLMENIKDEGVKKFYKKDLISRMWDLINPKKGTIAKTSITDNKEEYKTIYDSKDKTFLSCLIMYPSNFTSHIEKHDLFTFNDKRLSEISNLIVNTVMDDENVSRETMISILKEKGFNDVLSSIDLEIKRLSDLGKEDIQKQIDLRLKTIELKNIQKELQDTQSLILKNPSRELMDKIKKLKEMEEDAKAYIDNMV